MKELRFLARDMADLFKNDSAWITHASRLDRAFVEYDTFTSFLVDLISKYPGSGQVLPLALEISLPKPVSGKVDSEPSFQAIAESTSYDSYAIFLRLIRHINCHGLPLSPWESNTIYRFHDIFLSALKREYENRDLGPHVPKTVFKASYLLPGRVVRNLINIGHYLNPTMVDCLGRTRFHILRDVGSPLAWSTDDVDSPDVLGRTPLYLACQDGTDQVVDDLLRAGANPLQQTITGLTPLHVAAMLGHRSICLSLWRKQYGSGIQVYCQQLLKDCAGRTPFLCSVLGGHSAIVELFTNRVRKAQEDTDSSGNTAMVLAVRSGHSEVVKVLLRHKFPADTLDHMGHTPFWYAMEMSRPDIMSLLESTVEVDRKDARGRTPLAEAARRGASDCVRYLLKLNKYHAYTNRAMARVNLNSKDHDGHSPLTHAVESRKMDCVKLLVEHRPSVLDANEVHKARSIARDRGFGEILLLLLHGHMSFARLENSWSSWVLNVQSIHDPLS